MRTYKYLFIFFIALISSCSKDDLIQTDPKTINQKEIEYNNDLKNFCFALQDALKVSKDFRDMIKKEALLKPDGDNDVVLSTILERNIFKNSVNGLRSSLSVRNLMESSIQGIEPEPTQLDSSKSSIDELLAKYPLLQISIPVNAESWNTSDSIPVITFIPCTNSETELETLTGYLANGDTITLDAITPPTFPVIVICLNERDYDGTSKSTVNSSKSAKSMEEITVPAVSNLTGAPTASGITISWPRALAATPSNTYGYYIYRKAEGESDFVQYRVNNNYMNTNMTDSDPAMTAGKLYSYYVCAYCVDITNGQVVLSEPSNIVSVLGPNRPGNVLTFSATMNSLSEIQLKWTTDNSQYISNIEVSKHVVDNDPGFSLYRTFGANTYQTLDNVVMPGKKVEYMINVTTPTGKSNPLYDFVEVGYRDPSKISPVRIKAIKFTDGSIERWPRGHPEFFIKVLNSSLDHKSTFQIHEELAFDFVQSKSFYQQSFDTFVLNWQPGFWYDMISFNAIERDDPFHYTTEFRAEYKSKNLSNFLLDSSFSGSTTYSYSDDGDKIGYGYLNYNEPTNTWVEFGKYGFKFQIGQ